MKNILFITIIVQLLFPINTNSEAFLAPPSFNKVNKTISKKRKSQGNISVKRKVYFKSPRGVHWRPSMVIRDISCNINIILKEITSKEVEITFKNSEGAEADSLSPGLLRYLYLQNGAWGNIIVKGKFDRLILNCILDIFEQFAKDLIENQNAKNLANAYDSEIEIIAKLLRKDKKITINNVGCLKSL